MRDEPAMTFREIADALGLELRVVRADYMRAIRKLQQRKQRLSPLLTDAAMREKLGDGRQPIYPEW